MKILHAPVEIGGQMSILTNAQRQLGYESRSINYFNSWLQYNCDENYDLNKHGVLVRCTRKLNVLARSINKYDIYHFHFGTTLLPYHLDLYLLKLLGKKIVFHFHGCDARDYYKEIKHRYGVCAHCGHHCNADKQKMIDKFVRFADAIILSTPDLLEYIPAGHYVPIAMNLEDWKFLQAPERTGTTLKVLHAPSNSTKKGTRYLQDAVAQLQNDGYDIELNLVKNIPHHQVKQYYLNADIVVDQLLIGWYGIFACEMMLLQKPVLCYIREDLLKYAPNIPIVNTNIDTLYDNLKILIENPKLRDQIGARGKQYVEKTHDSRMIAQELISCYKNISLTETVCHDQSRGPDD